MSPSTWNAYDPEAWARALGLVYVPMFSAEQALNEPGTHAVMLDGERASFAMSLCDDPRELEDRPLSWAWSSDLDHAVIVDTTRSEFLLRRWDSAIVRRFKVPQRPADLQPIVRVFETAPAPTAPDVIAYALRAFRQVRSALKEHPVGQSVLAFTALLVAVERLQNSPEPEALAGDLATYESLLQFLHSSGGISAELNDLEGNVQAAPLGQLLFYFLQPVPYTGCTLSPSLLLRHAAGRLFQEANLVLEREPVEQMHFSGMAPEDNPSGSLDRDVRFTPPALARALAENAVRAIAIPDSQALITFFDPACGSGVFLVEAFREVQALGKSRLIHLAGFDTSDVSCRISRFCLDRAITESGIDRSRVTIDVRNKDALKEDWPVCDIVLMNPPFVPWNRMAAEERESVEAVLGELNEGHSDKAMAFVWKAAKRLVPGNALGSVIPASLLETKAGLRWREALQQAADLQLIGKFEGFRYFAASLVEPAFFVMTAKSEESSDAVTTIVLAQSGAEDESLRALRLGSYVTAISEKWEVYAVPRTSLSSSNWMPRPKREQQIADRLLSADLSRVGALFNVRQGIRAGHKCFSLSIEDYELLPKKEKAYFRPAATNSTIREGRLFKREFVFYPYGNKGRPITTEAELAEHVPIFYASNLLPARRELIKRAGIDPKQWWLLTRERVWQHREITKLVSSYFGGSGRFAFDSSGEFVVHQGHAWLWKKSPRQADPVDDANEWFTSTELPYAYLAIFNSGWFEKMLGLWCPRVQGGQFDLSNRFVDQIPVPDLASERSTAKTVDDLAKLGRWIHSGRQVDLAGLHEAVAAVYGSSAEANFFG